MHGDVMKQQRGRGIDFAAFAKDPDLGAARIKPQAVAGDFCVKQHSELTRDLGKRFIEQRERFHVQSARDSAVGEQQKFLVQVRVWRRRWQIALILERFYVLKWARAVK